MRKAYSPRDVERLQPDVLEWDGQWSLVFGRPSVTETWFISGASASGKSSFVMQLSKELCRFGDVLYVSYEEGVSPSFRRRLGYLHMEEVQGRFRIVTDDTYDELCDRLSRRKSARFVVIDSFQESGWSYGQAKELIGRFPQKGFLFVSQEHRGQPMGKPAVRLRYKAGVKVRVSGFKAWCQGRETENAGAFYTVWEDGLVRTSLTL